MEPERASATQCSTEIQLMTLVNRHKICLWITYRWAHTKATGVSPVVGNAQGRGDGDEVGVHDLGMSELDGRANR